MGCVGGVADYAIKDSYPDPVRDKVTVVFELVDEVYLNGVRVAEKTECRGNVCMVQLERATYLDCSAHSVAHAFAGAFHPIESTTSRLFCKNWRNDD